jgi:pimeloyl-ACP methyl ester carboxylesterase
MSVEEAGASLRGLQAAMTDPPRHPTHPAANRQLVIPSGPARPELGRPAEMNALFFLAAGEGPRPTMLLLHGLPGNERNLDLAQAVRRAGWNVLTFTYRGAWGSEGIFSLQHAVDDTAAALAFLRSAEAARGYGVDPARLVVAGHSMGGYMAAHAAGNDRRDCPAVPGAGGRVRLTGVQSADAYRRRLDRCAAPPLAGLVLLDAWDIAASARMMKAAGAQGRAGFIAAMDDLGHSLGRTTAADLADNLIARGEEYSLAALAPALARLRVLTIDATHGNAEDNRAITQAITRACPISAEVPRCAALTAVELDSDHAFADSRIRLAAEVVRWLETLPRTLLP